MTVTTELALITGTTAVVLAAIHFFAGRLRFLNVIPRSRWLSFSGGVSVAYVFIHILPQLSRHQQTIASSEAVNGTVIAFLEHHVYLVALLGLVLFYSLEQFVRRVKRSAGHTQEHATPEGVFWLHIGAFAIYNTLVGYLLVHREESGIVSLIWYTVALGLHFLVNDYGLRSHHPHRYHNLGRQVLAAAVVVGWFIAIITEVHPLLLALIFSFVGGSIILNVLKEELPEDRESRITAFMIGAIAYSLLLIML